MVVADRQRQVQGRPVAEDKEKLRDFYTNKGYVDYELKGYRQEFPAKTNRMVLKLDVTEGTQYKVGSVEFKGNEIYSKEEIKKNAQTLELRKGEKSTKGLKRKREPSSPRATSTATSRPSATSTARPATSTPASHRQKNANIEKGTIDVVHDVEEGG